MGLCGEGDQDHAAGGPAAGFTPEDTQAADVGEVCPAKGAEEGNRHVCRQGQAAELEATLILSRQSGEKHIRSVAPHDQGITGRKDLKGLTNSRGGRATERGRQSCNCQPTGEWEQCSHIGNRRAAPVQGEGTHGSNRPGQAGMTA